MVRFHWTWIFFFFFLSNWPLGAFNFWSPVLRIIQNSWMINFSVSFKGHQQLQLKCLLECYSTHDLTLGNQSIHHKCQYDNFDNLILFCSPFHDTCLRDINGYCHTVYDFQPEHINTNVLMYFAAGELFLLDPALTAPEINFQVNMERVYMEITEIVCSVLVFF